MFTRAFPVLIAKDLRLLARRPGTLVALWACGALVLLMMSVSGPAGPEGLKERGAAALWLGLFLGASVFLSDAFDSERSDDAQRMILVMGVDPLAFYYAKAVTNAVALLIVSMLLTPIMVAFFGAAPSVLQFLPILALGCFGLAAPGTLFAALVADSDRKTSLLPVVLLPLVVPVLIAATQATALLIYGDPMGQRSAWLALLGVFVFLHWTVDGLLYGRAVD